MTSPAPQGTYELSSVDRALTILSILAVRPRMRLGELSEELGANPSTVLRALRVLERHGLVRRTHSDLEYVLGTRLVELGQAAVASIDVLQSVRPMLRPLVDEFHATAHIGMVRTGMVTVLDKLDPRAPTVAYSAVGTRMPLHATAAGKAALALTGTAMLDELRDSDLRTYTVHTIQSMEPLRADIELTRIRRFSVEREEYHLGFGCVGTAFRIGGETYTVSISGSLLDAATVQECGDRLRDTVDRFLAQHAGAASGM